MNVRFQFVVVCVLFAGCAGKPTPSPSGEPDGMTSDDAIRAADVAARAWASDAVLFAVIGVEHGPAATVSSPPPHQSKADEGGRVYPCGPMDEEAWAIMDPAWPGRTDAKPGDGRLTAWQVVYFSTSKDQGTGFVVRQGRETVCVADPLTAQDREELKHVRSLTYAVDSAEAMTALRAASAELDDAFKTSRNPQLYYGFDLRKEATWGIKGHASDRGIASFHGVVDLQNANLRTVEIEEA